MSDSEERFSPFDRRDWIALGAIALFGAIVRFSFLESLPPALWYDEGLNGCDALELARGGQWRLAFPAVFPREPMLVYLIAIFVKFLGPETLAVRLAPAFVGSLAPPLAYVWLRQAASRRVAIFAAVFLAGMRWHVHFSRIAFRTIWTPTLALGCFALLWMAFRSGRKRWAAAAGAVFGLGFYSYLSWYFFVPVAGLALALGLWRETAKGKRRGLATAFCVAGLVVATPMWIHYCFTPTDLTGRASELSLFSEGLGPAVRDIVKNGREAAVMVFWKGDHVSKHNIPWKPALEPIGACLWLLGVGWSFWMLRRRPALGGVVLAWMIFGTLPTVFSKTDSPNFLRTLVMAPAVAVAAGLGAEAMVRLLEKCGKMRRLALAIPSVAVGASVITMLALYFVVWPRHETLWEDFSGPFDQTARYARTVGDEDRLLMPPMALDHWTYKFLASDVDRTIPLEGPETLDRALSTDEGCLILDAPFTDPAVRKALWSRFPDPEIDAVFFAEGPWGKTLPDYRWASVWRLSGENVGL